MENNQRNIDSGEHNQSNEHNRHCIDTDKLSECKSCIGSKHNQDKASDKTRAFEELERFGKVLSTAP